MILMSSHLARAKSPWLHLKQTPAQTTERSAKEQRIPGVSQCWIGLFGSKKTEPKTAEAVLCKKFGRTNRTQLTEQTPEDPEIFPKLPFASWRSWGSSCWISSSANRESDWEKCRVHTTQNEKLLDIIVTSLIIFTIIRVSILFLLLLSLFVVVLAMIFVATCFANIVYHCNQIESSMLLFCYWLIIITYESSILVLQNNYCHAIISWCHTCAFILSSGPHQTLHHPPPDTPSFCPINGKKGLQRHTAAPEMSCQRWCSGDCGQDAWIKKTRSKLSPDFVHWILNYAGLGNTNFDNMGMVEECFKHVRHKTQKNDMKHHEMPRHPCSDYFLMQAWRR